MVVNDAPDDLCLLKEMLSREKREVATFSTGAMALKAAVDNPPDLILLDVKMPEMDGYQVCSRLKENVRLKHVPVIFLGASNCSKEKIRAFRSGGADYIPKPFQVEEVQARVAAYLDLRSLRKKVEIQSRTLQRLEAEKAKELSEAQMATIFALAKIAESRDDDTGYHLERVRVYCQRLATRLGEASHYAGEIPESFVTCLYHASPLHDIGKVAIPDRILLKPGALTAEEADVMKRHTVIGADHLKAVSARYAGNAFIEMGREIARHHHEWWDGTGYPDGLGGRTIPLSARIMAVADSYDALCSNRCYRKGVGYDRVNEIIAAEKGTHFDPVIVEAFLSLEAGFRDIMEGFS